MSLKKCTQNSTVVLPSLSGATVVQGALAPYISETSMTAHYGHYLSLLERLNRHLDTEDTLKRLPLQDLVRAAYNNGNPLPCFNLAAEVIGQERNAWHTMLCLYCPVKYSTVHYSRVQ